jgi:hypothetical protein
MLWRGYDNINYSRTVKEDSLVEKHDWEVVQENHAHNLDPYYWPDFPVVTTHVESENKNAKVFYACGTDHAAKTGLFGGAPYGVVVIPREGEENKIPEKSELGEHVYVTKVSTEEGVSGFSSTKVRKAIEDGDKEFLTNALSKAAAEFILNPSPAEKLKFAEDFKNLDLFSAGKVASLTYTGLKPQQQDLIKADQEAKLKLETKSS